MMKENNITVFNYVKENEDNNITAKDIAEGTGIGIKSVNGIITAAFCRKGLMERVPAEIEKEDGTHEAVKLVKLTDAGRAFDPTAEPEKDAE